MDGVRRKKMNTWYFWEQYEKAIDKTRQKEVTPKELVVLLSARAERKLDREIDRQLISRFLSAIKRMPRAWGGKDWTTARLKQANQLTVENDLFRRRIKRELGLR